MAVISNVYFVMIMIPEIRRRKRSLQFMGHYRKTLFPCFVTMYHVLWFFYFIDIVVYFLKLSNFISDGLF